MPLNKETKPNQKYANADLDKNLKENVKYGLIL